MFTFLHYTSSPTARLLPFPLHSCSTLCLATATVTLDVSAVTLVLVAVTAAAVYLVCAVAHV